MIELLLSLIAPPDMTGPVAVHAAYVINTRKEEEEAAKCCGLCKGGFITHGDGHRTPCPCPPDCLCKAVRHPASVLKTDCQECTPKK